tara:strand:- start:425 stop:1030 length:606 start_codon:yes stop_codon:yes gene_type:complete
MVFLKVHSIVAGTVVAIVVEVFFGIGFLVLDTMAFSNTSCFLVLSIDCFTLSIKPSLDIMSSSLPKRIKVFFDIDFKPALNSMVFFDILGPLIDSDCHHLTIGFNTQVFFGIIAKLDYFDFTISLHDSIHLHLGLAKQQQMALLEQLISIADTDLSCLVWKIGLVRISRSFALVVSLGRRIAIGINSFAWRERNPIRLCSR